MALLKFGHRQRGPVHDLGDIPALSAGILLAQQFGVDWYVNSAAAAGGDGKSPDSAVTTLAAAVALATAGDRIYLAPGHAETITGAGGITISKAGMNIIGLGAGLTRPTFTFSQTASTFIISGANVVLSNVRTVVSIDEVVVLFSITGNGVILDRVDFSETTSVQLRSFATVTGTDCRIQNCDWYQANAAGAAQVWITLTGADRFKLLNNVGYLTLNDAAASAVVSVVSTACKGVLFDGNKLYVLGYSANLLSVFLSINTTTGVVSNNFIYANVAANTTINDMPGCASFLTLCTNAVNTSGILDPIADT